MATKPHPVLESELSQSVILIGFDGMVGAMTRGLVARLPESAAQLASAFSVSGLQAWIPRPPDAEDVAFAYTADPSTGETRRFRVIDREIVASVIVDGEQLESLRLQLTAIPTSRPGGAKTDYSEADYGDDYA